MTESTFLFGVLWLVATTSLITSTIIYYCVRRSLVRNFGPRLPVALISANLLGILITLIILFSYHG
jgi:hypothetical protein